MSIFFAVILQIWPCCQLGCGTNPPVQTGATVKTEVLCGNLTEKSPVVLICESVTDPTEIPDAGIPESPAPADSYKFAPMPNTPDRIQLEKILMEAEEHPP